VTIYFNDWITPTLEKFAALSEKVAALQPQQSITQAQYDAVNSERDEIRNNYNINGSPAAKKVDNLYNALSTADKATLKGTEFELSAVTTKLRAALAFSQDLKQKLQELQPKIEGRGEGE
jgi:hypothetical protein